MRSTFLLESNEEGERYCWVLAALYFGWRGIYMPLATQPSSFGQVAAV